LIALTPTSTHADKSADHEAKHGIGEEAIYFRFAPARSSPRLGERKSPVALQLLAVTDLQLYLAIGIPAFIVLIGILMNAIQYNSLNARFNSLEGTVNSRFNNVDGRFNSVETRLSGMDARFNRLDDKFETLIGKVIDVDNRVTRIEAKLGIG
jgi:hypothetical protein